MSNIPAVQDISAIEATLVQGDLSRLTPDQRLNYFKAVCESVGLNPLTKPFEYQTFQGKVVLYARKDATDQLRKIHGVSITKLEKDISDGICTITAYAKDRSGKEDSDIGVLDIKGLTGEKLANAVMKCTTKAKRRVTLSICGLGILDESELDSSGFSSAGEEKAAKLNQELLGLPNPAPVAAPPVEEEAPPEAPKAFSEPPICHDQPMKISKYVDDRYGELTPWYCATCKAKERRETTRGVK